MLLCLSLPRESRAAPRHKGTTVILRRMHQEIHFLGFCCYPLMGTPYFTDTKFAGGFCDETKECGSKDYRDSNAVHADDHAFKLATFCGKELTGICSSERLSVVAVTQRARSYYKNFPKDAYVIEEMLFDHFLVIQKEDGSVFSYGPHDSEEMIADSLSMYLFPQESQG